MKIEIHHRVALLYCDDPHQHLSVGLLNVFLLHTTFSIYNLITIMSFANSIFMVHLAERICDLGHWVDKVTDTVSIPLHFAWILLDVLLVVFLIRGIIKRCDIEVPVVFIIPAIVATIGHFNTDFTHFSSGSTFLIIMGIIKLICFGLMPAYTIGVAQETTHRNEFFLSLFVYLQTFVSLMLISRSIIWLIVLTFSLAVFLVWTLVNIIRRTLQRDYDMILINMSILVGAFYDIMIWIMQMGDYTF